MLSTTKEMMMTKPILLLLETAKNSEWPQGVCQTVPWISFQENQTAGDSEL